MNYRQFFNRPLITRTFGFDAANRVKSYMRSRGYFQGDMNATSTAAALILMGCTATGQDLETFGRQILSSSKKNGETLFESMDFILSNELNAVTIKKMIFDRANSVVIFELVDGSDFTIPLNVPIQSAWTERPAIELSQAFLISLVMDLQEQEHTEKGELLT